MREIFPSRSQASLGTWVRGGGCSWKFQLSVSGNYVTNQIWQPTPLPSDKTKTCAEQSIDSSRWMQSELIMNCFTVITGYWGGRFWTSVNKYFLWEKNKRKKRRRLPYFKASFFLKLQNVHACKLAILTTKKIFASSCNRYKNKVSEYMFIGLK